MPVDLVVVNRDSSPYLLCNIFEFGEIIFEYGENFSNWFDEFYDETLIDRELYFLYMEEKIDMYNINIYFFKIRKFANHKFHLYKSLINKK